MLIALSIGFVASLAVRPPGAVDATMSANEAQSTLRFRWRVGLSASTNLPRGEIYVYVSETLRRVSNNAINLELFDPGEITPAFAVSDAVQNRKIQAGITWLGYDQGKIPASVLFGATPFGMEPWAYMAWWFYGGGHELADEIYRPFNVVPILCNISGPETAGWFKKPINSLLDLEGLKIRFAGLGGQVLQRAGASVTLIPAGEIFQALETGLIDASEFSTPDIDIELGFPRIAKYNYFPGWHQPFSAEHLLVNLNEWNGISAQDRTLIESTCTAAVARGLAHSESSQGPVIAEFQKIGVTTGYLPNEILRELKQIADDLLDEEAQKDDDFKTVLQSQRAFQAEHDLWSRYSRMPN